MQRVMKKRYTFTGRRIRSAVGHLKVKGSSVHPASRICLPREMRSLFHRGGIL
jgi:hypothetical protein